MRVNDCVVVCAVGAVLSVALTEKVALPPATGVPEIVPAALRLRPVGSDPETSAHVYAGVPPVAVSDCEYGAVARALGSVVVLMLRAAPTVIVNAWVAVWCVGVVLSVTWTVKI